VSRKSDRVICMGVKALRREASGFKRVRSERSDPFENFKSFYDEEGGFFVSFRVEFRWPLAHANVKFGECICCSTYACLAFCFFVSLFFR
jgi:hypothetical protein